MTANEQRSTSVFSRLSYVLSEPLRHSHALKLSRRVFGNNAGLEQNLQGQWELMRARRSVSRGDALAQSFWQTGFMWVPGAYDPERFEAIRTNARALLDATPRPEDEYIVGIQDARLRAERPEIFGLVDDRIRAIVERIYAAPATVYSGLLWRTFPVPQDALAEREVYSNHWHNDSGKVSNVALFVLMCDASRAQGPMRFVTRKRTRELMRVGYAHRDRYGVPEEILEDGAHVSEFAGSAGTALLLNTSICLHRAGIPEAGHTRDMVRIDFYPAGH